MTETTPTPGELLAQILRERGLQKAELGRRVQRDYLAVHRWTRDEQFTARNQRIVAQALGLAPDFFAQPAMSALRERARAEVFEAFLSTPLGAASSADERATLEGFRFASGLPTVELYTAMLLALRGHLRTDKIESTALENAALARRIRADEPRK